jgi:hypothetical protein
MSKIAASIKPTAIASQLQHAGANPKAAPVGQLARMIAADLKGGAAKHEFAFSIISAAIYQAFKGNQRDIPEALALCSGKSAKARAYHAGFAAIADLVKPVTYTGKLDAAHNADVRADIASKANHATAEFERAMLCMQVQIKDEAASVRAQNKAEKEASDASAASVADATSAGDDVPQSITIDDGSNANVEIGVAVDAVCDALATPGFLTVGEITLLRLALAAHDEAVAASTPVLMAA